MAKLQACPAGSPAGVAGLADVEPLLVRTMRAHPERIVEVVAKDRPKLGTSARGFVAEYDAAVRGAQVQALRAAALEIEAELVCCDVFERRHAQQADPAAADPTAADEPEVGRHAICYWGAAAARLVSARADLLAAPDQDTGQETDRG